MRKFRLLTGAVCLCLAFVSGGCGSDGNENGPSLPPDGKLENAFAFDGVKTGIRSMFFEQIGNFDYVFLSSDRVKRYEDLMERDDRDEFIHPFIELAVDPSLVGKTVHVKTEKAYFAFYNMTASQGAFGSVETGMTQEIDTGSFTVGIDDEKKTVGIEFRFTLASGKVFEGNCTTDYEPADGPVTPDAAPDTYAIDGAAHALGSVFAFDFHGLTYLTMTPAAGLESWEEVYDQEEYIAAAFEPSLIGRTVC